ncbi:MAG: UbiX family flavin prenyltransferase [Pirellulaceae bacterium]|nr:UbiX family flavin prenyltransferase [Pirellulaceae bacterium]
MHPLILAITGASGAVYAVRLLDVLLASGREVHLLISPSGKAVLKQELSVEVDLEHFDPAPLYDAMLHPLLQGAKPQSKRPEHSGKLLYHHHDDFMAPPASGSFLTGGMVVCPCSGSTLSGIAHAASMNLIQRAADVHLKEHRRLILVPREAPLSVIQLDNLRKAAEAGAVILPAMPGWYHGVSSIRDLVDFVVARILDQLAVPHTLMKRWGS